ncbi:Peroxisomal adenine nucleotide transporter 1 [Hyphodiscus hymeniophilus]|uniref:Peroxisomal adenine nucleotide transporter 1 n=1 Tax=Hyphodiscus hymeniophilus TaxID=353542 RepID=A0A9P7AW06_9HELO|nr:Peroxisomal adenine nucleotide transporter 1 [Hyphodiscus hymeniophilus]
MANVYNSQLDAYSLYHKTHEEQASSFGGPALPALGHAVAGSTGTAISNLAIYPLNLIITRLQVQRQIRKHSSEPNEREYKGVLDAFEQIYNREGGIPALYTGILQDTGKSIADSFLFFLFYNYLRTNRLQKHGSQATTLPVLDELAVGAFAGACSKFFTTPISNIVTRKQTSSMILARSGSDVAEPSVSDIASTIRDEKGLQGFWSGYSASLVLTLNPSLTFFLYETFKRTLLPRARRDDPGARITFLMAAVSKAIASTITYPFSLAKARAQISSKPPVDEGSAIELKDEAEGTRNTRDLAKSTTDAKSLAEKSTVFNTILHIYRTEGPAALYEGVFGEILKGFFSHGITMLLKEAIHKLIIQTYFLILKALKKYPSPSEITAQAGGAIQDASNKAGEMTKDGYAQAGGVVQVSTENVTKMAKEGYENASSTVGSMVQNAKEAAGIVGERIGVMGNNTSAAATTTNDYVSKDAGHLLGNARDMLGDKLIEGGKGVKNEE